MGGNPTGTRPVPPRSSPASRLSDGVVRLAPFELVDAETVLRWDADPDVQRWYDWPLTPSADDPATYAARLASAERTVRGAWQRWDEGAELAFIIHAATTREGLGWLDLQPRGPGRGNVAYGVLAAHRGRGAATRAVILASAFAFEVLGWVRLELQMIADNDASRAVAVRAGFQFEGILRSYGAWEKHQPLLGRRFDWAIYSRLRTDPGPTATP